MAIEIKVPTVGESINEVTLVKWHKQDNDWVNRDEVIAELESEKATFEINAEQAGLLKIIAKEGDTLHIGDTVCSIDTAAIKPESAVEVAVPKTKTAAKNNNMAHRRHLCDAQRSLLVTQRVVVEQHCRLVNERLQRRNSFAVEDDSERASAESKRKKM